MSSRLDQEREEKLQPQRIRACKEKLESMGFTVESDGHTQLTFEFKGSKIQFWPYSGWHTGKTIHDGRGFNRLLAQLTDQADTPLTGMLATDPRSKKSASNAPNNPLNREGTP